MSIEAIVWVLHESTSERASRLVLIAIANNANNEGKESFPSVETIARNSRLSLTAVHRAINDLVQLGELTVEIGASRYRTNVYSLPKFNMFTRKVQGTKNEDDGTKNENGRVPNPNLAGYQIFPELVPEPSFNRPIEEPSKEKELNTSRVRQEPAEPRVVHFQGIRLVIEEKLHQAFASAFEGIDLEREYLKMDAWLVANKTNYKNFGRFSNNWLSKCLPKIGGNGNGNGFLTRGEARLEQNKRAFQGALLIAEERDCKKADGFSRGDL